MSSSSDEELVLHRNPATSSVVGERRSSRRTQHKALEEVKRTRASGNVHRVDVETLIQPVYEEVNEDEYMSIVRERQKDDFVVDDDGSGYVDHGVDIFDDEDEEDIEGGVEGPVKRKKEKREKPKKGRLDAFLSTIAPKKTKDESSVSIANDPDVEAMLNECNFDAPSQEVDLGEEYSDRYMKPPLDPHIRMTQQIKQKACMIL
ncbi:unnamed protein product [Anisakis simplex]|uniref:DNA_pol_alpha_N domain-containing protein n=1 Tax=Anisakis simplex TaxID=6269 RepID=A0A0M3KDG3_ANISI|nr:unnamed protein product [Anisakis simplex]